MLDVGLQGRSADGGWVGSRTTAKPIFQLKAVAKRFRSGKNVFQVFQGIDREVRRGEVVALVGPSGAGKTTPFRVAAGLLDADSGAANFQGMPLPLRETHRGRQGMFLVFQDPCAALSPIIVCSVAKMPKWQSNRYA